MSIIEVVGDATAPADISGNVIIVQGNNDEAKWGAGFVLAVSKRWPAAERAYRTWPKQNPDKPVPYREDGSCLSLSSVQFVAVEYPTGTPDQASYHLPFLFVANMITQRGIKAHDGSPPVRYWAIGQGLRTVAQYAKLFGASVHMPLIGCGLAGGDWDLVRQIVECELDGIPVYVYTYKDESSPSFVTQQDIARRL